MLVTAQVCSYPEPELNSIRSLRRRGAPPSDPVAQRGQNMVEFALLAPLLFVLIFVIIEGALFINARATLDNATREGARVGALCGSSTGAWSGYTSCQSAIESTVQANFGAKTGNSLLIAQALKVTYQSTPVNPGDPLSFTVTYPSYKFYLGSFLGASTVGVSLASSATVVAQQ